MPGPARRSRRTRNKPPEVIPPKPDETENSEDEDGKEESDQESERNDPLKKGRSSKPKTTKKVAASKSARQTTRTRNSVSSSRPSSPADTTRRRRRTPNSIDFHQESKDEKDNEADGGKSDEEETEHSVPTKKQRMINDGRTRRSTRTRAYKVRKSTADDDDISKVDDSDSDTGGEMAERHTSNDDSDGDSSGPDEKEKSVETAEDDGNDSDNEPISALMKRKRQTHNTKIEKADGAVEDSAGDNDRSEDDAPEQSLATSSATSSTDETARKTDKLFESDSRNMRSRRTRYEQSPRMKIGAGRSTGDEGDSDKPPHKRTRRRGLRGKIDANNTPVPSKNEAESIGEDNKDVNLAFRRGRIQQNVRKQTEDAESTDEASSDGSPIDDKPPRRRGRLGTPQESGPTRNGGRSDGGEKSDNSVGAAKLVRRRGKRERTRPTIKAGDTKTPGDDEADRQSGGSKPSETEHDETSRSETPGGSTADENRPDENAADDTNDPPDDDAFEATGRNIKVDLTSSQAKSFSKYDAVSDTAEAAVGDVLETGKEDAGRPSAFMDADSKEEAGEIQNTQKAIVQMVSSSIEIYASGLLPAPLTEAKDHDMEEDSKSFVGIECAAEVPNARSNESQVATQGCNEPTNSSSGSLLGNDIESTAETCTNAAPCHTGAGEESRCSSDKTSNGDVFVTSQKVEVTSTVTSNVISKGIEGASTAQTKEKQTEIPVGFQGDECIEHSVSGMSEHATLNPVSTKEALDEQNSKTFTASESHKSHAIVDEADKRAMYMDSSRQTGLPMAKISNASGERLEESETTARFEDVSTSDVAVKSSFESANVAVSSGVKTRSDLEASHHDQGEQRNLNESELTEAPSESDSVKESKIENRTPDLIDVRRSVSGNAKDSGTMAGAMPASDFHSNKGSSLSVTGAHDGTSIALPAGVSARVQSGTDGETAHSVHPDHLEQSTVVGFDEKTSDTVRAVLEGSLPVSPPEETPSQTGVGQTAPPVTEMGIGEVMEAEGDVLCAGRVRPSKEGAEVEQPHIMDAAAFEKDSEVGAANGTSTDGHNPAPVSGLDDSTKSLRARATLLRNPVPALHDTKNEPGVGLHEIAPSSRPPSDPVVPSLGNHATCALLDAGTATVFVLDDALAPSSGTLETPGTLSKPVVKESSTSMLAVSGLSVNPITRDLTKQDPKASTNATHKSNLVVPHDVSKQELAFGEVSGEPQTKDAGDNNSAGLVHGRRAALKRLEITAIPGILSVPLKLEYKVTFGRLASGTTPSMRAAPMVSTLDVVGESKLRRVKSILFSVGSKVHRGAGFERVFAEYWDAMALRLSGKLSCHTSGRCQQVIHNFLKTAKLRKLHNKFILCIMRQASTKSAGYDELAAQVPSHWRDRIKVSPVSSENHITEGAPIAGDLAELNHLTGKDAWLDDDQVENGPESKPTLHRTIISPTSNVESSSLPGALTVDPLVRKLADKKNMQVSELALWLMSIAVKEHTTEILKTAIAQKESIEGGYLPERRLKFPNVLASNTKPSVNPEGSDEVVENKETESPAAKVPKQLTILDLCSASFTMPHGRQESVGGSVSRSAIERSLHASYDHLCALPGKDLFDLQQYVTDQIFAEAKTRIVPAKPKVDESTRTLVSETTPRNPIPKQPNSFTVPPPAPAAGRSQPIATTRPVPQEQTNRVQAIAPTQEATIRGMGRGAKDLTALMKRSTSVVAEPSANERTDATPHVFTTAGNTEVDDTVLAEDSLAGAVGGERQGKGFGTKNLAAMRARATTQD